MNTGSPATPASDSDATDAGAAARLCGGALCADCLRQFAAVQPRCRRCALAQPAGAAAPCPAHDHRQTLRFEHTVCVGDYGFPWDRLIGAFKFEQQPTLARALAAPLAVAVDRALAAGWLQPPALVLPLPLADAALARRGYNQAWELARRCARSLGLPARADVLLRLLDTEPQHGLPRLQRQRNLRHAFMVEPALQHAVAGRRLALVDDVMTTGATADEAAGALLAAGAAAVDVWVVARTPAPAPASPPASPPASAPAPAPA